MAGGKEKGDVPRGQKIRDLTDHASAQVDVQHRRIDAIIPVQRRQRGLDRGEWPAQPGAGARQGMREFLGLEVFVLDHQDGTALRGLMRMRRSGHLVFPVHGHFVKDGREGQHLRRQSRRAFLRIIMIPCAING